MEASRQWKVWDIRRGVEYHEVRKGNGASLWKAIKKEGYLLSYRIMFSVGNGRRVRFWKDKGVY